MFLLPGSGKSVCFACISRVYDKLRHFQLKNTQKVSDTIVVFPLSALMQDQVTKFSSRGLKAAFIGGEEIVKEVSLSSNVQLLYFSPEVLLSMPFWREMLIIKTILSALQLMRPI